MRTNLRLVMGTALLGLIGLTAVSAGHDGPACEPGYTVVEEVCHYEVVKKICKAVPDKKKTTRTVYSCKEEDFCVPECPHPLHAHGHDCAADCGCATPRTKRQLVKKKVTDECETVKWVVEKVTEKVPYKVYHKVPCGAPLPPGCTVPGVPPAAAGEATHLPPPAGEKPGEEKPKAPVGK